MKMNNKQRMAAIYAMVQEKGFLNLRQVCRLMNGYGKDEYDRCYFTFKEKPKGTTGLGCKNEIFRRCCYSHQNIHYSCMCLIRSGAYLIRTRKLRFWDSGGIGTDVFRFLYIDQELFKRQVLDKVPPVRDRVINS